MELNSDTTMSLNLQGGAKEKDGMDARRNATTAMNTISSSPANLDSTKTAKSKMKQLLYIPKSNNSTRNGQLNRFGGTSIASEKHVAMGSYPGSASAVRYDRREYQRLLMGSTPSIYSTTVNSEATPL